MAGRWRAWWMIVAALALCAGWCSEAAAQARGDEAARRAMAEIRTSELGLRLAPMTAEQLEEMAAAAMTQLRIASDDLVEALVAQKRAHDDDATPAEALAEVDAQVEELLRRRSADVTRAGIVLDALEAKGGDVASARAYVGVVQMLSPQLPDGARAEAGMSEEARAAAELDRAVAGAIARVRDEPPVHERDEPWAVPLEELGLELRPLTAGEIEARVRKWIEILEREVRERVRIDIALQRADDDAVVAELAARSAKQQEVVQAIVKRVRVALMMLQARGGDVAEHQNYIATATGQKLNLRDPEVLWAQVMAWARSPEGGMKIARNVLAFLGILGAFWVLAALLGRAASSAVGRIPRASVLLRNFLVRGVRRLTLLIGLVVAVSALGVNITPLVAAIGAAGLVVGLALQGTLSNFASGILILIYRPYDVGDVISGGGVSGKVESMNLVSTTIATFDNQVLIVPNNEIWNNVITNITGRDTRRVDLTFGIGYGADIGRATEILEELMASHEKVLEDPAPMVRVHELGDSSVNLIARPWARTSDYWDVYWDLMRQVKERFDEEGVNIPFPQRDLHVPGTIEVRLAGGVPATNGKSKPVQMIEAAPGAPGTPVVPTHEPGPAEGQADGDSEEGRSAS